VVHRTPLYAHKNMLKGKKHMCNATNIEELTFEAERGIGQGESVSSQQWALLYDMLLKWIDSKNRNLHEDKNLREYSNETARDAAIYAFADDLATCSAGPQAEICSSSRQSGAPHSAHSLD
jgi:hypothetical protein